MRWTLTWMAVGSQGSAGRVAPLPLTVAFLRHCRARSGSAPRPVLTNRAPSTAATPYTRSETRSVFLASSIGSAASTAKTDVVPSAPNTYRRSPLTIGVGRSHRWHAPPCEVPLVRPGQWQIEGLAVTERRPPEAGPALLAGQHRPVGGHVFRSPRHLDHVARPQRRHLDPVDDRMGPAARGATHDVQGAGSTHQLVVHACRRDVVGECPPGALVRVEAEQLVQVAGAARVCCRRRRITCGSRRPHRAAGRSR